MDFLRNLEERKKINNKMWKYTVTLSYVEIYNEKVQVLLEPSGSDLPIREDNKKNTGLDLQRKRYTIVRSLRWHLVKFLTTEQLQQQN